MRSTFPRNFISTEIPVCAHHSAKKMGGPTSRIAQANAEVRGKTHIAKQGGGCSDPRENERLKELGCKFQEGKSLSMDAQKLKT